MAPATIDPPGPSGPPGLSQSQRPSPRRPPGSTGRPWYRRWWLLPTSALALVIVVAVAVGAAGWRGPAGATSAQPATGGAQGLARQPDPSASTAPNLTAKEKLAARDRQAARSDAQPKSGTGTAAAPAGTWRGGSIGTYLVGSGIPVGTYESAAPASGTCSWSRLKGLNGTAADVTAAGHSTGASTVTITASDTFFQTTGCSNWHKTA